MSEIELKPESNLLEGLAVLLVEDNPQAMNLTRTMLTDIGVARVATACNGSEALDYMGDPQQSEGVNIILCDWNMPKVNGIDLLKQVRTCNPDLPFVMMSGRADLEATANARAHGVTSFIVKPFSCNELKRKLSVVARIMHHRAAPV